LRSYALSEFGSWFEGHRAFTSEDIAERKLVKLLPIRYNVSYRTVWNLKMG